MAEVNLRIGTEYEANDPVYMKATGSRAVFICGKRGSGKSYTMGVIVEELFNQEQGKATIIIVDPMGIYHTMSLPNEAQADQVRNAGFLTSGFPIRLIVPGEPLIRYGDAAVLAKLRENGVEVTQLQINAADLSSEAWCELFDIGINEAMGIALWRAVDTLHEKDQPFTVDDILAEIERDTRAKDTSKEALENRLTVANRWGIFAREPTALNNVFSLSHVNVLDLSVLDAGTKGLRNMVLDVVARRLFTERTRERRREEFGLSTKLPRVWLAIDEAHQFVPKGRTSLCKGMLIRWVKEGRQPGLSLIVATQQPAAIDPELLSQCDVIIAHKITTWDDIYALDRLSATYMTGDLKSYIRSLNRRGEALLVDDETESVTTIRVRPRFSSHGGAEIQEKTTRKSLF
ncbi:MAG: ATP-binding protein [Candidatus Poribacteria bacterium]|nr:ATP-binding protein [Candidatus Poribacteria bacterium]